MSRLIFRAVGVEELRKDCCDPFPRPREVSFQERLGVRGRVIRKDRSAHLVLSVTLIRQSVAVEIDAADVAPL